ncbi:Putative sialic acid transporter [Gemmata sp. SH-PL17]|uniref:MFS transporter n=1 Tax=Gemmata sp. SH-PL17 TaxID=1630693 RepID=UPI00078BF173|nr:MFS transporter [Gemmata sp. SH-PL17]AMV24724.1 Putative sialic acid transporter [Gemmata sp. SH-PL17]
MGTPELSPDALPSPAPTKEVTRLRDISPQQWKSGAAAWLGWMFDGLDMHLYVLVATPFVAELIGLKHDETNPEVRKHASMIMAAFLFGWALGGGFFGRIADRIGRSRALVFTILTYAICTGLGAVAQTWWQLMIFRFLAALGIGGEWAIGASILSETWPKKWRPWIAAVLQSGVNVGVMIAAAAFYFMADLPERYVFLVGVAPAFIVLWIRKAVPEPEEWAGAREAAAANAPRFSDLFRPPVRRITVLTLVVCSCALTAHWAFLFWFGQHLRAMPELAEWTPGDRNRLGGIAMWVVIGASIVGNFIAAAIAQKVRYRWAIVILCLAYCATMTATYCVPRDHNALWVGFVAIGLCQGVFGLFTMYMPPLFPTLLRTTGAGFCYNFGRIAAGIGTLASGALASIDYRLVLLTAGFLFIPAAAFALMLPEPPDEVS